MKKKSGRGDQVGKPFTAGQGQCLAFICYYTKIHGRPPAEADFQRFFRVTPPVVHQMIKTLQARGFIDREPGKARSTKLRLTRGQLPDLESHQLTPTASCRFEDLKMDELSDIWIEQCDAAREIRGG